MKEQGAESRTPLEFSSVAAVISHARQGLGWTLLPRVAADEDLRSGRLSLVAWDESPLEAACLMIWRKDRWLSPALSGFMDLAREALY